MKEGKMVGKIQKEGKRRRRGQRGEGERREKRGRMEKKEGGGEGVRKGEWLNERTVTAVFTDPQIQRLLLLL